MITKNNNTKQEQFLDDFGLNNRRSVDRLLKKDPNYFSTVERMDGEGNDHYNLKHEVIDHIKKWFGSYKNLYVFNELEQLYNPFISEYNKSIERFKQYQLDICVIYFNHNRKFRILDIEIDGKNHYKPNQMIKDGVRDVLLKDRYDVHTERIDVGDPVFKHFMYYLCNNIGLTPDC
jgi:hypothetical protein